MIAPIDYYLGKGVVLSIHNLQPREETIYHTKWTLYEPKKDLLFLLSNV